jgi:hypothetical protein
MEQVIMHLERAGSGSESVALTADEWRVKTRGAPGWWLEQAKRQGRRPAPAAAGEALALRQQWPAVAGWIAGCCTPGVSIPAYARKDGEHLPEQFTPRAIEQAVAALNAGKQRAALTWGHDGPELCSGHLDFCFRASAVLGLEFTARLSDTAFNRQVVAAAAEGLPISIGFQSVRQWVVERQGVGQVRVVDEMRLHHVAIIPPEQSLKPAYSGARCYGSPGEYLTCPHKLRHQAEQYAYRLVKQQAGVRS